jgi:hypothetical protein
MNNMQLLLKSYCARSNKRAPYVLSYNTLCDFEKVYCVLYVQRVRMDTTDWLLLYQFRNKICKEIDVTTHKGFPIKQYESFGQEGIL